ncbi:START domain-containing protein [Aphelenchoides bicaudatus]|nr:START domain-containing protein [Aphelenchoides bicaudatus]
MIGENFVEFLDSRDVLEEEDLHYLPVLSRGIKALENCYSIFNSPDYRTKTGSWKKELISGDASVHSTQIEHGKLFSLKYKLPISLQQYITYDWDGVEHITKWNPDVEFARRLKILTKNADIVHYANKAILMVSARDYVSIRVRRITQDGVVYTSGFSIDDLPDMPPEEGRVRGVLHVSGGRFQQNPSDLKSTVIELIICIDARGNIPKALINSQMPKQLCKETEKIKRIFAENRHIF